MSLLVAAAAVAGSIATAAPAHAWTCQTNDEVIPPEVGEPACDAVLTVAGAVCRVVKPACFY